MLAELDDLGAGMSLQFDKATLHKVEELLRKNCPSPETDLATLGKIVAYLPDSEETAKIRRLVLDIDDLTSQIRWHLGQALLLMETQPQLFSLPEEEIDLRIREIGIPTSVLLGLRGYIAEADRVLYDDLTDSRRGGTVAGWIMHMMIDDAIYRVIAALDRIAHLLWHTAGLPKTNSRGGKVRIYFRSGKIQMVHQQLNCVESSELLKLAESRLVEYLIEYRDGFSHELKAYSHIAYDPPADMWKSPDGKTVIQQPDKLDAETLFALGNAAYHQLLAALKHAVPICERIWASQNNS